MHPETLRWALGSTTTWHVVQAHGDRWYSLCGRALPPPSCLVRVPPAEALACQVCAGVLARLSAHVRRQTGGAR